MIRTSGKIIIDSGEHFRKKFKFRSNNGVDPVDFTEAEEITVAFQQHDLTWLVLSTEDESPKVAPDGDPILGNILVNLDEATTALLKRGEGLNIEVSWTIDGEKTIVILERVLEVRSTQSN